MSATREFVKPDEAEEMTDLTAFLTHASLEAGEEQASPHQSSVEMMTLHSAKGLEFPRVFMVGVEEGLFPSFRSFEEPGRLEEERRLAYVGITRAKQKLTISYAGDTCDEFGESRFAVSFKSKRKRMENGTKSETREIWLRHGD